MNPAISSSPTDLPQEAENQHQLLGGFDAQFKALQVARHPQLSSSGVVRLSDGLEPGRRWRASLCRTRTRWRLFSLQRKTKGSSSLNASSTTEPAPLGPPPGATCTASSKTNFNHVSKNCHCSWEVQQDTATWPEEGIKRLNTASTWCELFVA